MPSGGVLPKGTRLNIGSGGSCRVERFLAGGGQGEVYVARVGDEALALKWYFPASATSQQRSALELLVRKGAPDDRFLWPFAIVQAPGIKGFGYLMRLREDRFKGIVSLMKRKIDPSFRALCTAGLELADSYLRLHAAGLCYRDISFGNVFFDPDSGEVLICDNDNVSVDDGRSSGVSGTIGFMAPEIMVDGAPASTQTDLWSLAVLLFHMFHVSHPLEGALESKIHCLDYAAKQKLYGKSAVFIFDPSDESNRPIPGLHDNALAFWSIYPGFFKERFVQTFGPGIRKPYSRTRESEWKAAMSKLRDCIVYGPSGAENFYDPDSTEPLRDWASGEPIVLPPRIEIGRSVVMLNSNAKLFAHHVSPERLYDFSQQIASVSQHPTNPNLWGLRNTGEVPWKVLGSGTSREVEPGKSVSLAPGTRIDFGEVEGEIVA